MADGKWRVQGQMSFGLKNKKVGGLKLVTLRLTVHSYSNQVINTNISIRTWIQPNGTES